MTTFTALPLSASAFGRPVPLGAGSTPLHTAPALGVDEIYLVVNNVTAAVANLTVEFGGVTVADQVTASLPIPANSTGILVVQGQRIGGGLTVSAFSSVAAALNVTGWVNRIV